MSYSRLTKWHDEVTDERMAEYLLTWLTMWGMTKVGISEACDVDDAIQDDDELCWSIAIGEKFISGQFGGSRRGLTKKAIKFIKEIV